MPVLNGKYNHRKVYRPPGTRYADAKVGWPTDAPFPIVTSWTIAYAIEVALNTFNNQFMGQDRLKREDVVVEVACDTFGVHATVYEIVSPS